MKYHFKSAKITSPTTDKNYGGCFVEDDLVVALEIETDGHTPALHQGKSIFDAILTIFRSVAVKDNNLVKVLLQEISGNPHLLTAIIGIIVDSNLYLGCSGKGQVVLVRGEDVDTIVSGGFISHGQIRVNDKIIFHSDRLAKVLGNEMLGKLYRSPSLEDFEEELAGKLSGDEKVHGCAVLGLIVTDKKEIISHAESKVFKRLSGYFSNKTKRQKIFIILFTVLVLGLIINTFTGIIRTNNSEKVKQFNSSLNFMKSEYDEAQNLIELNPVRARELLATSKLTVSQLLSSTKKNSKEYKILTDWFEKISASEISAFKIYKLTAVPVFFDISLIKPEGKADSISSYQEKKVILDKKNKNIYFLDTSTKQSGLLAGENTVKNAQIAGVHGNSAYFLNDDGIYRIDIEKKTGEKIIEHDASWGEIVELNAFAGNLYLLDRKNNSIWKYVATENGFSERRSYINQGVPASLVNMEHLEIDGSIWLAGSNNIVKYTAGNLDQFSFQGFGDTISKIDSFSTSDSEKNIYILDKALKRIIVFDKDGLYDSQYQWEDLKNAKTIAATENEGKIYVLIGNKIYAIDLK